MTRDDIAKAFAEELENVAPDVDLSTAEPDEDLREAFELDSMDILNLVSALHKRLGVDIPEADYERMVTVKGAVDYLSGRLGAAA